MVKNERRFTDERCQKIIELKKSVCDGTNKTFVVINEKGIDPICLEKFAAEGIMALRRAKRRNMERIVLACGGTAVNSVEGLTEADLVIHHLLRVSPALSLKSLWARTSTPSWRT